MTVSDLLKILEILEANQLDEIRIVADPGSYIDLLGKELNRHDA